MTTLTLGDFQFARYEIPESLPFGSAQKNNVHTLVGGTKVIDVLGPAPVNPSWSGFFVGDAGLDRARYLKSLADAGKPLAFTYSEFSYQVLIADFKAEFRSGPYTPYSITLEVISDLTSPITGITDPDPSQLVNDDLDTANGLADTINDPTLTGLMGTLSSAVAAVGELTTAAASAVAALQTPITAAIGRVNTLLSTAQGVLGSVSGVAGIIAGGDPVALAAGLSGQVAAAQSIPNLLGISATLGRISGNITAVGSGVTSIAVGGGNLFQIAASQYGDPMAWTTLAQANGLTDPTISGIATLIVPPAPAVSSGGVLNA